MLKVNHINSFHAICLFIYPQKIENLWFYHVFRVYRKTPRVGKWVNARLIFKIYWKLTKRILKQCNSFALTFNTHSACIYLFKFNNGSTRTMYKICSKLTIKTERLQWHRSGILIVNVKQISHIALLIFKK